MSEKERKENGEKKKSQFSSLHSGKYIAQVTHSVRCEELYFLHFSLFKQNCFFIKRLLFHLVMEKRVLVSSFARYFFWWPGNFCFTQKFCCSLPYACFNYVCTVEIGFNIIPLFCLFLFLEMYRLLMWIQ